MTGLSIREFARRDGCNDKVVRNALKSGHLSAFEDGTIDPTLVGTGWRAHNRRRADIVPAQADKSASTDVWGDMSTPIDAEAARLVRTRENMSLAEAERRKEVALASLRELELAREEGKLVPIEDAVAEQARDHLIVRNLLLSFGSKMAPTLAPLKDAEAIKSAIDDEVAKMFASLGEDSDA